MRVLVAFDRQQRCNDMKAAPLALAVCSASPIPFSSSSRTVQPSITPCDSQPVPAPLPGRESSAHVLGASITGPSHLQHACFSDCPAALGPGYDARHNGSIGAFVVKPRPFGSALPAARSVRMEGVGWLPRAARPVPATRCRYQPGEADSSSTRHMSEDEDLAASQSHSREEEGQ